MAAAALLGMLAVGVPIEVTAHSASPAPAHRPTVHVSPDTTPDTTPDTAPSPIDAIAGH